MEISAADHEVVPEPEESRPPIAISKEAQLFLESQGLKPELIQELKDFCNTFRYDMLVERLAALREKTSLFVSAEKQDVIVHVPYLRDITGKEKTGNCTDIALQFIVQLKGSALWKKIETALEATGTEVTLQWCSGTCEDFFNQRNSIHAWNELVFHQGFSRTRLVFDAALQRIVVEGEVHEDTRREIYQRRIDVRVQKTNTMNVDAITSFTSGKAEVVGERVDIKQPGLAAVLGYTKDQQHVFSLGFLHFGQLAGSPDQQVKPFVYRTPKDGSNDTFLLHPQTEQLICTNYPGKVEQLDPKEREEILEVLREAGRFSVAPLPNELKTDPANGDVSLKNTKVPVTF